MYQIKCVLVPLLGFLVNIFFVFLLIIEGCPDRLIVRFTRTQISIRINMGMILLTSEVIEAVRGQKHPSEAKNIMKELI
jgi:hypothetical protein